MNIQHLITNRFAIADPEQDMLGQGGMGIVYRGTDTETGELVAIKALNPELVAANPDLVARFTREGEALRQLNHPNIVKMLTAVSENDRYYLIMEYVSGGDLRQLLDHPDPLPIPQVLEIALGLADALTRAHSLEIIHRDLKPANILLAEDGTPRLTDFGVAHLGQNSRLTQTGMLVGTIDYLSPEACNGETLDARADIWAFGVLLVEMLLGKRPFTQSTLAATLTAILTQPVPDLQQLRPDIDDALADLIYRMLTKERLQRIPTVRLVGAELESILHGFTLTPSSSGEQTAVMRVNSAFATPVGERTAVVKHNLPAQTTRFVGRVAELTELSQLLDKPQTRLLTILGAGGMGKTRLALATAEAQLETYTNGAFFVPLAALQAVDSIVPAIAEAIHFSFYDGSTTPTQQLLTHLRSKKTLLIMDNFEHLLAGNMMVSDILQEAPEVTILATSRAKLNVQGEHLFRIAGMDFPDWETPEDALEYSAVKLFMQSARRRAPRICTRGG